MTAIYKKEMRSFFTTPMGYIFIGTFLGVSGFLFAFTTLQNQSSDVATYFQLLIVAYIILLPLLTMKSFSEEKRMKTEQLLICSPVSITGMVMAKVLSAFTMFISTLLVSGAYFFILTLYGKVNPAKVIGCMIAVMFVGMCFIAIGVFVSSITENQFTAALITIAILTGLVAVGLLNDIIDVQIIRRALDFISIYSRYDKFTYGIFDVGAAVYYLSICSVFIFLTVNVFEKRRWSGN